MLINDTGFEEIYRKNYSRIYSFLYRLSSSTEVTRLLTEKTFYRAYYDFCLYDGSCEIYTWLCLIAKDLFVNYLHKTGRAVIKLDLFVTDLMAPLSDAAGYRLKHAVDTGALCAAIDGLPKRYSDVLILRIYGEIPYNEIAKALGINTDTARLIFYRAKKHIKEVCINE